MQKHRSSSSVKVSRHVATDSDTSKSEEAKLEIEPMTTEQLDRMLSEMTAQSNDSSPRAAAGAEKPTSDRLRPPTRRPDVDQDKDCAAQKV